MLPTLTRQNKGKDRKLVVDGGNIRTGKVDFAKILVFQSEKMLLRYSGG
jgi:hypothetical protein